MIWNYKVIKTPWLTFKGADELLNMELKKYGNDGWELVQMKDGAEHLLLIFKQPVAD